MVDTAIFQIGSIKTMKEYCLVGLYTNFHNFSRMCKFNTLWSPTIAVIIEFLNCMQILIVAVFPFQLPEKFSTIFGFFCGYVVFCYSVDFTVLDLEPEYEKP